MCEHHENTPLLTSCFLGKLSQRVDQQFKGVTSPDLQEMLAYDWPDNNIQELAHTIEQTRIAQPPIKTRTNDYSV